MILTYPSPSSQKAWGFTFPVYSVPFGRTVDPALKLGYDYSQGFRGGTLTNNTAAIGWILFLPPSNPTPSRITVIDTGLRLQSSGGVLIIPDNSEVSVYAATGHTANIEIRSMFYKR